jgi:hypothetical protein
MPTGADTGVDRVLVGEAEMPSGEIENLGVNSRFDHNAKRPWMFVHGRRKLIVPPEGYPLERTLQVVLPAAYTPFVGSSTQVVTSCGYFLPLHCLPWMGHMPVRINAGS